MRLCAICETGRHERRRAAGRLSKVVFLVPYHSLLQIHIVSGVYASVVTWVLRPSDDLFAEVHVGCGDLKNHHHHQKERGTCAETSLRSESLLPHNGKSDGSDSASIFRVSFLCRSRFATAKKEHRRRKSWRKHVWIIVLPMPARMSWQPIARFTPLCLCTS